MSKKLTAAATTTCQICGRPILANTGVIAHHGYKRPGGWQTASCFGARELPYEQSRDAIPTCIASIERFIARKEARIAELEMDPPATLTHQQYAGFGQTRPVQIEKPADFDPATARADYRIGSYVSLWLAEKQAAAQAIKASQADIKTLQARYDAWVPPQA